MFKLYIFDMDGTLIDSISKWAELFEKTLEKVNICAPRHKVTSLFGASASDILNILVTNGKTKEATAYFISRQNDYIGEFRAFPHSKKTLEMLKKKGLMTAVATGNRKVLMDKFLKKFGMIDYLDCAICIDDVKRGKPAPDMLLEVLNRLKISPKDAIYIADAPADLKAAKKAGMSVALVTTGVCDEKTAKELRPDFVLKSIKDVEKLV
jgi:HAD superfamily hydrolase (TIGR01509 family)